jgi:hypothetical protein
MNSVNYFKYDDDFYLALEIAKERFPDVEFKQAHPKVSGWDGETIYIQDRWSNVLTEFSDPELANHFSEKKERLARKPSTGPSSALDKLDPLAPPSTKAARLVILYFRWLANITSIYLVFFGIQSFITLAKQGQYDNALFSLVGFALLAFVSYWIIRVIVIGLELLADIAYDARLIRLRETANN